MRRRCLQKQFFERNVWNGTAVVINPIKSFGYKGVNYKLPELEDPVAAQLKDKIMSIQYNLSEDPYGWRVAVD